jgi:hypothetical protein
VLHKNTRNVISTWLLVFIFITVNITNTKAQTCTSTTNATYYPYNWRGQGGFFQKINSGGYLFGFMKDERQRLVTRVDDNANILWSKLYSYVGSTNILNTFPYSNGVEDNNGNYFIDMQAEAFALLDPQGNIITTKHLKGPLNLPQEASIHSLLVLPDNRKLLFVQDHSGLQYYSYHFMDQTFNAIRILWSFVIVQPG